MLKKKYIFLLLIGAAGIAVFFSCNTESTCNERTISPLRIGFYNRYYLNDRYQTKDSIIAIKGLSGSGSDSVLINDTVYTSKIILPLSEHADSSVYSIDLKDISETFWVTYKRSFVFINYDCGFRTDYVIDTLLSAGNSFDSIYINSHLVTDNDEEHIKIFFNRPVSGNN